MALQLLGGMGIGLVWGSLVALALERGTRRAWNLLWLAGATGLLIAEARLVSSSPWVAASITGATGTGAWLQHWWYGELRTHRGGT